MRVQIVRQQNVAFQLCHQARLAAGLGSFSRSQSLVRFSERRLKSTVSARVRRETQKLSTSISAPVTVAGDQSPKPLAESETVSSTKIAALPPISLESTRPTELNLPKSEPNLSRFQFLFRTGKAYASFYLKGIKNVWANYKTVQTIQSRIGSRELNSINSIVRDGEKPLSFAEYELILRSRHDLKKLIPFGLIFAICGEFTPLVVLALGSRVVPATCRIPRQREKDLKQLLERDDRAIQTGADLVYQQRLTDPKTAAPDFDILNDPRILHLTAYTLSLTPFSKPLPIPGVSELYINFLLRRRLKMHFNSVIADTTLIQREGGFGSPQLTSQELWEWGIRYGMHRLREYARQGLAKGLDEMKIIQDDKLRGGLLPAFEREGRWIMAEILARRKQPGQSKDVNDEDEWKLLARAQANAFASTVPEMDPKDGSKLDLTPDSKSRREAVLKVVEEKRLNEKTT